MSSSSARDATIRQLKNQLVHSQYSGQQQQFFSTGFPEVDVALPQNGLPTASVIEWISDQPGQLSASLALTLARGLLSLPGCIAVIDARHEFYPTAVCHSGIPLSRLLLVRPQLPPSRGVIAGETSERRSQSASTGRTAGMQSLSTHRSEALWALEQCARCPGVRLVVCWLDRVTSTVLRRLQLAVEHSGVTVCLMRPASVLRQPSWADLRIGVQPIGNTKVQFRLLQARNQVPGGTAVALAIDHETGAVRSLSQLAGAASVS
jgi:hypothetical protein